MNLQILLNNKRFHERDVGHIFLVEHLCVKAVVGEVVLHVVTDGVF